ncbi:hypothetical protein NE237_014344 [Protea cynaroides]|uniref:Uncharacterized protein n=1 Tax=Protea cynaroides TaxID=273540 RepID=A0A9Q0KBU9_9MAGN|nr:hypothetical protein NE237_014344 [Protea cynaroides]
MFGYPANAQTSPMDNVYSPPYATLLHKRPSPWLPPPLLSTMLSLPSFLGSQLCIGFGHLGLLPILEDVDLSFHLTLFLFPSPCLFVNIILVSESISTAFCKVYPSQIFAPTSPYILASATSTLASFFCGFNGGISPKKKKGDEFKIKKVKCLEWKFRKIKIIIIGVVDVDSNGKNVDEDEDEELEVGAECIGEYGNFLSSFVT